MEKEIIITLDYELPGNGSGDLRELVISPTGNLLKILASRSIRMTVFFEIEEYLVFKKYSTKIKDKFGYDFAAEFEEQLKKIVEMGHEIALHVHPQWIGGAFVDGKFELSNEKECLFDVFKREAELLSYFESRVATLTALVKKYDPSYEVKCFRAGGLALRPEGAILKALQSVGIKADSSVLKGQVLGERRVTDYRDVPNSSGYWFVDDNVSVVVEGGGIVEFPIYTKIKRQITKISVTRIRNKFLSSGHVVGKLINEAKKRKITKSPFSMLSRLADKVPVKLDYCHMSKEEMLSYVYDHNEKGRKYPLTMIGHSKEFFNEKNFSDFLDVTIEKGGFSFKIMGDVVDRLIKGSVKKFE